MSHEVTSSDFAPIPLSVVLDSQFYPPGQPGFKYDRDGMSAPFPDLFRILKYLRYNIGRKYSCTTSDKEKGEVPFELRGGTVSIQISQVRPTFPCSIMSGTPLPVATLDLFLSVDKEGQYLLNDVICRDPTEIITLVTDLKGDVNHVLLDVSLREPEGLDPEVDLLECKEISTEIGLLHHFDDGEYDSWSSDPCYHLSGGIFYLKDYTKMDKLMDLVRGTEIP